MVGSLERVEPIALVNLSGVQENFREITDRGRDMHKPSVFLFIDNSNIFISAKDEATKREGVQARNNVRLDFENLYELAVGGRNIGKVCVVGSIPPEQQAVWDHLEAVTGVKAELYERGEFTGGEQGLDQCLQVHMLRAISDHRDPQIVVLMTGDGAGYDDGVGFHADMERMHEAGWGVEVLSWRSHCRRALREWATAKGVFVPLDDYYSSITFLKGSRSRSKLDLSHRAFAVPRPSPTQIAEERGRNLAQSQILEMECKLRALEAEKTRLEEAAATRAQRKSKHDRRFDRGSKR